MSGPPERALVTGAASGIGRATALRLARRGAVVAALDRDAGGARSVAHEIAAKGGEAFARNVDVTDAAGLEAAIGDAVARLGGLDTAVACAGVEVTGSVVEMSVNDWDRVIAINLTGTFLTARFALPHLLDGGGAFVAVSSDAGLQGAPGYAAYCASKHGVVGLVRAMALDHGPQGVRCNAVCPGFTWTPMAERLLGDDPEERAFWEATVPLGRFGLPEEIADVIAHLSSAEAAYTNGLLYAADGGGTAGFFGGNAHSSKG